MSITRKRFTHADRILDFLKNQNKPLTAYEILEMMREQGIRAATTVYRALDKLHERGSIHRIESLNAWTVCCGSHKNKIPVFEICNDCGDVKEHLDQRLTDNIKNLSFRTGFKANKPVLEIHGLCGNCSTNL